MFLLCCLFFVSVVILNEVILCGKVLCFVCLGLVESLSDVIFVKMFCYLTKVLCFVDAVRGCVVMLKCMRAMFYLNCMWRNTSEMKLDRYIE